RYPVPWSGDNGTNYENMLASLRGGLSLGMSGFTYWSQDTGGFGGSHPDEDLYLRWTQLSIFQSHIRFHSPLPAFNEPWNYSKRTQDLVRPIFELRYRLIPYLYSESALAARQGLPLMRPLILEFFDDPNVYGLEDQFMCGRNLLVAPIMEPHPRRRVYLPEGTWYEFHTGERLEGPQWVEREWPIETFPLFVRAGTVLPLAPVVQHTGELSYDRFTLNAYPQEGVASIEIEAPDEGQLRFEVRESDGGVSVRTSRKFEEITVELPGGKAASIEKLDAE
ncbi:MAG: glycoside hydrolase family 31 protein, partial [Myxococcota bacterium]